MTDQSEPSAQGHARGAHELRRRDRGNDLTGARIDLADATFVELIKVLPVEGGPASQATSSARVSLPLSGSRACSLSPLANHTSWPSKGDAVHPPFFGKGSVFTLDFDDGATHLRASLEQT